MKATDAIQVVTQIPQPPGQPAKTETDVVCPVCRLPVTAVMLTAGNEPYRSHLQRREDGSKCPHGETETDPVGTLSAF